jgi:hypothetical protein
LETWIVRNGKAWITADGEDTEAGDIVVPRVGVPAFRDAAAAMRFMLSRSSRGLSAATAIDAGTSLREEAKRVAATGETERVLARSGHWWVHP